MIKPVQIGFSFKTESHMPKQSEDLPEASETSKSKQLLEGLARRMVSCAFSRIRLVHRFSSQFG